MKYKALKSVAHNFGDSFASTLNYAVDDYIMSHLARRALASGQTEMKVNLLPGEAGPPELVGPPVDESITVRVRWFPALLASQRLDLRVVRQAQMCIVFDTPHCTAPAAFNDYTVSEIPFDCWVTVLDDHDRTHAAHFRRWWPFSVDAPEFHRRRRRSIWQTLSNAVRRLRSGTG